MLVEPISASEGAAKWREAEAAGPPLTPEELAKKADDEKKAAKLKAAAAKGSAPEAAAEEAPAKGKAAPKGSAPPSSSGGAYYTALANMKVRDKPDSTDELPLSVYQGQVIKVMSPI